MPRAWVIHGYDGYQGLSLEDFAEEQPGSGEIRLKIEAFALNWGDMDLMHDRVNAQRRSQGKVVVETRI